MNPIAINITGKSNWLGIGSSDPWFQTQYTLPGEQTDYGLLQTQLTDITILSSILATLMFTNKTI